jgi:large repetitive protein
VDGADPVGSYVYDGLGRQTVIPAGDAPYPDAGEVEAEYFDSDVPASVSQGGVRTAFTVDVAGRRLVETATESSGGVAGGDAALHGWVG